MSANRTKNIFITGRPGCGKTTLIMEIIRELELDAGGFYTREIREKDAQKGFKIITLDGKEGVLAHVDVESPYRVSKYKVNVKDLEETGVKSILKALEKDKVCVIDEVGKMEMISEKFKKAVLAALNSPSKVLATIKFTADPFTSQVKKRKDVRVFYLTRENFQKVKKEVARLLQSKGS